VTRTALGQAGALGVAASGVVRLAHVAEQAAERLLDHPEPAVRRAAALLAAAAYPLLAGLEATPAVPKHAEARPGVAPATASRTSARGNVGERPAARPDDLDWLGALVRRSPVVADARRRAHWRTLLPWLNTAERYALAATLLDIEQHLADP
jgi:hypothetical protein